jgi:hypothetical protein
VGFPPLEVLGANGPGAALRIRFDTLEGTMSQDAMS